jgi:hypothetical protein
LRSRRDFIFTIGYDGPAAVIDGQAKKRYASLSTVELAEKGLFRAACSSAVLSQDPKELEAVAEIFNRTAPAPVSVASIQRLFGVFPANVSRSIVL